MQNNVPLTRFRLAFDVELGLNGDLEYHDWHTIKSKHPDLYHSFLTYKVQTAEVNGDLSEIVDLFVRINLTGKRLTSGEKRHARFFRSAFLKAARPGSGSCRIIMWTSPRSSNERWRR